MNNQTLNPAILTNWSAIQRRIAESPAVPYAEQVTTQLADEISSLDEHEATIGLAFWVDAIIARFPLDGYFAHVLWGTDRLSELQQHQKETAYAREATGKPPCGQLSRRAS